MTQIDHPKSGVQQLWRNNVYQTLDDLREILENPRIHTGCGYRRVNDKMLACCACGDRKSVGEFTNTQARNRFGSQKCKACVDAIRDPLDMGALTDEISKLVEPTTTEVTEAFSKIKIDDVDGKKKTKKKKKKKDEPQILTEANLDVHNEEAEETLINSGDLQRRQFCCGTCVPPNIFFKKVPRYKPVVKCPECKKTNRNVPRLQPVPRNKERGYAHFKCGLCNSTWGSSRGGRSLGNYCRTPNCANQINDVPIYPMTIMPFKKNHKSTSRHKQAKRSAAFQKTLPPMESEERPNNNSYEPYSASSRVGKDAEGGYEDQRHNPYNHSEDSYDFAEDESSTNTASTVVGEVTNYEHRCTGCASGICRNRKVPLSKLHDSTGSTNSSSGRSGATWSVISFEDSKYQDRDEAFVPTTSNTNAFGVLCDGEDED